MKYFIYIFYNGTWHIHSGWTTFSIAKMKLHELQQLNRKLLMTIDLFDPNQIAMKPCEKFNISNLKSHNIENETQDAEYWQDIALTFKEQNQELKKQLEHKNIVIEAVKKSRDEEIEQLKTELKLSNDNAKIIEANADYWHDEHMKLKKKIANVINHLKYGG